MSIEYSRDSQSSFQASDVAKAGMAGRKLGSIRTSTFVRGPHERDVIHYRSYVV